MMFGMTNITNTIQQMNIPLNKLSVLLVPTKLVATSVAQQISGPETDVMILRADKMAYFSVEVVICCNCFTKCSSVCNNQYSWRTNSFADRELYAFDFDFYSYSA